VSTLTKVFIVLTAVLSIALSCMFIAAAAQWNNWKALALNYQTLRDAAITQQQSTAASAQAALALKDEALAAQARKLDEALNEVASLEDHNGELQRELAQVKNERLAFEAGRTKLQEILDVTTGELKALQKQNQTLLSQNIDLQSRGARLNSRVLELTTSVTIQQDQIRNIQEKLYACEQQTAELEHRAGSIAARPMAESPEGAVAVAPTVAGEIRGEITELDGIYATINVGESSGVVPGMTFMVYRAGGEYLADLVIERVRPNQAGGKLTTIASGEVRAGDSVVYGMN
jgi:predicted  nucleic acid-binding Zn-ribbon protein